MPSWRRCLAGVVDVRERVDGQLALLDTAPERIAPESCPDERWPAVWVFFN